MDQLKPSVRRRLLIVLVVTALIDVTYMVLLLFARDVVASNDRPAYFEFENSFPLADTWLLVCLVMSTVQLVRGRRSYLLWLLVGAGAGLYLFCIDVLYDLENGIWWSSGAGGLIELGINLVTLAVSVGLLLFAWPRLAGVLKGANGTLGV